MIVVDASALVAIGNAEPDAPDHLEVLRDNYSVISSMNYVETGIVLISRRLMVGKPEFDAWLDHLGVAIHSSDDLSEGALAAYLVYGRGFDRARLNLADCFAYALAKRLDAPLLYKGDDFPFTDVKRALQPT
ncbi:MAG TPA: type II toxin-antitoxin system VapC family toxin [Caulobacteraceae bacterium]|nr:type II toxin-antitoxin system VapC family toxin [Caulobacteraceae bacterium]